MSNAKPARGMRDFLPVDVRRREYVIGIIKQVYESYGFEPLETPAVENLETLMGKYGEEGNQLIFKILKRGEKLDVNDKELADLALRYDLTVPLARVVANHKNDLPKFFKRYQIQPVWRADRPARGRFREFFQCDVDAIGSNSMIIEAEILSAASEILQKLGFKDFEVRVNHRKLLVDILNVAGVPIDKHTDALVALDKLDKIGREGVEKEFLQRGISPNAAEKLLVFFESLIKSNLKEVLGKSPTQKLIALQKQLAEKEKLISKNNNVVEEFAKLSLELNNQVDKVIAKLGEEDSHKTGSRLKKAATGIAESAKRFEELIYMHGNLLRLQSLGKFLSNNEDVEGEGFSDLLKLLSLSKLTDRIVIDPSLARGLSYYTGAIMEIVLTGGDFAGSIGGGGRYDELIGMFGKEQIPACGFSLGLERIIVVMTERNMFPADLQDASADVLVTIWNEDSAGESLKLANDLRAEGLRVLVYPEADKLG
ncbi:MAG TPA: histidine--tRNA ligase, partial [Pyrinomonadaceae bacterium]